jgi:hypothetical protein
MNLFGVVSVGFYSSSPLAKLGLPWRPFLGGVCLGNLTPRGKATW